MSTSTARLPITKETDTKTSPSPTATDSESSEPKATGHADLNPAPDGGLRAWLAVAGAASIYFSCLGFLNSFGIFQEYYMGHQLRDSTPDAVAWIGSLPAFIQFAAGAIAGPLFDRYGAWVLRPGVVLYILAIMLTSICTSYWHFMLTQGVLLGIAMSMMQVPALAAVLQYFDKRRAAALGIVISGSSVGGIVFPIALSKMLNDSALSFGWSVRVMGFVVTPLLGLSCFAVVPRLPPRETDFFIGAAFRNPRYVLLIVAIFCAMAGMFNPLFFLPTYAVSRGVDATLASYLLAIVNGASTVGRIVPGFLADRYGRLNVFGLGSLATGAVVLCMNSAVSEAGLIVYAVAFGLASGTIISGMSAAISTCTEDAREMGTYMGMALALGSVASLVGPPVNGALLEKYGGFLQPCIFSGIMCLAGGATALGAKATTPQGLLGKA